MKLKERTANNVHTAFVEEAKAHQRLSMFAEKRGFAANSSPIQGCRRG